MNFSFDIGRNKPLGGDAEEVLSINKRIATILKGASEEGISVSTPVITDLQVSDGRTLVGALEDHRGHWQSATSLKTSDPQALRMLRYKYRDWRIAALDVLKTPESLQTLGMDEVAISHHLDSDNTSLFAVPGEFDTLEWRCIPGFQFGNHTLNHVSELSGAYSPRQEENEPTTTMKIDSSSEVESDISFPGPHAPVVAPWWHGHQHQIFLVFACGFLTASLFGAIIFKLSPCDISQVRNQIDNMAVQIDQRCNFSQTQPQ